MAIHIQHTQFSFLVYIQNISRYSIKYLAPRGESSRITPQRHKYSNSNGILFFNPIPNNIKRSKMTSLSQFSRLSPNFLRWFARLLRHVHNFTEALFVNPGQHRGSVRKETSLITSLITITNKINSSWNNVTKRQLSKTSLITITNKINSSWSNATKEQIHNSQNNQFITVAGHLPY